MKLTLKHAIAAIFLMLSFAAPVTAGPFEDASAAYDKGDYATALRLWLPLAKQGDAIAQFNLGQVYVNRLGVPKDKDYVEVVRWYRCLTSAPSGQNGVVS